VRHLTVLLVVATVLSACGGIELNPFVNERRAVRPEQDPSKTLTVVHDLVFDDKSHASHELHLPAGAYALEAEDEDYWYFRSSVPLELREFKKDAKPESRSLRGGLALGKYSFRAVPAAAYIDGEGANRVIIWQLGKSFLKGEGRDWRKSF
jgi:hypothetical protein